MRRRLSKLLIVAAATALLTSGAAAQDLGIKIPLPPIPKFEIPKPPLPKVKIQSSSPQGRHVASPPRRYDYYPDQEVYFDPARSLYFFLEANRWMARRALPPSFTLRAGAPPVVVELSTENPYELHEDVRRMYPTHRDNRRRYGYREGFDDGYGEGYSDGYNAGFKSSFNQGYADGYRAAQRDRERDRERGRDHGRDRDRNDHGDRGRPGEDRRRD